jgi:hypothetical protein
MSTRSQACIGKAVFTVLAITLLFSQSVLASPPLGTRSEEILHEAWGMPKAPEARLELWRNSLERFLDGHPNLSAYQREVLENAMNGASPDLFADRPSIQQKTRIVATLLTVKKALYCTNYAEIFTGFEGLGTWLRTHRVVAKDEGTPCNCGGGGCADTFRCVSLGCYAEPGTTNYGRCQSGPAPEEEAH